MAVLDSVMTLFKDGPVNDYVQASQINDDTEIVVVTHVNCSCDWCEEFEESSINHIYHRLPFTNIFSYQHSQTTEIVGNVGIV